MEANIISKLGRSTPYTSSNIGSFKLVLLKATPIVREVLIQVLGTANLDRHINTRGYVVGINDPKNLDQIVEKLAKRSGAKIRLLSSSEGNKLLEDPTYSGLRRRLIGVGINSLLTQTNPALAARLFGLFNGGKTFAPQPTILNPGRLGIFVVVEQ